MKNESWSVALRVMVNISGWIAFPVIIGLFLGRWLDKRFETEPWLFLATIGVCFLISIYGLVINALKEFKKIEKEYADEKTKEVDDKAKKPEAEK